MGLFGVCVRAREAVETRDRLARRSRSDVQFGEPENRLRIAWRESDRPVQLASRSRSSRIANGGRRQSASLELGGRDRIVSRREIRTECGDTAKVLCARDDVALGDANARALQQRFDVE